MKTRRNALLLSFCAVLLVVASVFGTVAYMTSKDQVKNTFTVGKVAINLDEAKVTDDGKPVEGADRVKENRTEENISSAPKNNLKKILQKTDLSSMLSIAAIITERRKHMWKSRCRQARM